MNFPTAKPPYNWPPITITFTAEEYNLLLWVMGAGYRSLQEKGQSPQDLERLDQLRAHILSADLFDRTIGIII